MTAPPSSHGRMDWHGSSGPPPPQHPYHPASYDSYHPNNHDLRGPPPTPGSYHPGGGYSPHRPGPPPRIHPPKYWQEQQRRPPRPYGPPSMYDGPSTPAYHHGEGRQGPPPPSMNPIYPDGRPMPPYGPPLPHDYYNQRRDMYQPPPPFRTPPSHLRRGGDVTSVVQSSSFSSKEETPEVERSIPAKSSDWEPTRSTKQEKGKKQGDSLSLLAKVAMEPAEHSSNDAPKRGEVPQEGGDKTDVETITSPSKDESEDASPLHTQLRSSPIITPNSVVVPPPSSVQQASQPPVYRETTYPSSTTNTVTPKPITPTGTAHYGQPPSVSQPQNRPNHLRAPYGHGPYDDPHSGPYPPTYGMTPPHGAPPTSNYGPPPVGTYPSGYDSRSGSWEQPLVPPPNPSPAVVEERNSFDSYESSGTSRGSSQHYYPYYPEYARDHRGYPPYPTPAMHGGSGWQQPSPHDPRYPSSSWGGYEQQSSGYPFPPPPPGYPTPPQHHMTPPHGRVIGGPPPTPQYYDDRSYHMRPSASGYGPMPPNRPYSYMQQPPRDEKTILRKKFSWKHFPEVRVKRVAFSIYFIR
jgi:hypothetical protein